MIIKFIVRTIYNLIIMPPLRHMFKSFGYDVKETAFSIEDNFYRINFKFDRDGKIPPEINGWKKYKFAGTISQVAFGYTTSFKESCEESLKAIKNIKEFGKGLKENEPTY